ncbi:MAG: Gfo/Idh/MocA family protein [Gemmatimonadales bacterium]
MRPVHVAILGCGKVARLHSRIARTMRSRVRLSYASRSRERAEEYRRKYNGVRAYSSYEEACADDRVEAVFDCTPHALRVENAELATRHGKHLLMEKPAARTLEELATIERHVAGAGVRAMVAENYFFKPLVRVLQAHIEHGDIGTPMVLELNHTKRSKITGWRCDREMMAGGALLEGGVHWVNLLMSLGGPPLEVVAARPTADYPQVAPVEDSIELLIKFADGAVGKLLHSWNITNRIGGLGISHLYGSGGNIHFESNGLFAVVVGGRKRLRIPGLLDIMGYRRMLEHFVESVRRGEAPQMSLALARRDMAVIAAAYRSLDSGRFERVNQEN